MVQPLSAAASAPLWFFPLFTSFPALPRLRVPREFGNLPNSFPAVRTHGKGIQPMEFGQPLVRSPKAPELPTRSVCKAKAALSGKQLTGRFLKPRGFGVVYFFFLPSSRSLLIVFKLLLPPKAVEKSLFSLSI